ncbi:large ribosomal subunit protein mL43 [Physcomitrium patens]|uniref:Large ribosomal subunit protein mL43 n=1 Tax=Physcomitrium patens TaxID=3218 RepID=A9S2L6_PHYPA|nr:39S ribosomal protein L43, mitochondrial-like [Physcomitrium patens]PNR62449.1 hypothetical protein PHYPA_000873 [Physcomitrium patens]|eukprot:XP_024386762.1 39S ribosomal protein L43, mitochondrial-like [Physcomitrella patens]
MAVRGVWQLQKLIVCFCDHSGSSAGAREFVARIFPTLQKNNPQFEVATQLVPGQHPYLRGLYLNKNDRVVDVKNKNAEEILTQAMRLRNSTGRKVVKLKTRHVTFNPSVQGSWSPEVKF